MVDNNALCTSAAWNVIFIGRRAPTVMRRHIHHPPFAMSCPLAMSYSIVLLLCSNFDTLMIRHMSVGMTVSHAPLSIVTSIWFQPLYSEDWVSLKPISAILLKSIKKESTGFRFSRPCPYTRSLRALLPESSQSNSCNYQDDYVRRRFSIMSRSQVHHLLPHSRL